MKEDYLWNKTGNDSEIEKLENALKAFRQKNMTPPELPAKTFVLENNSIQNQKPKRFLQFAFAGFACLALVIISIGVFQISSNEKNDLAQNNSEQNSENFVVEKSEPTKTEIVDEGFVDEDNNQPIIEKAAFKPKQKRKFSKVNKNSQARNLSNKSVAKTVQPKLIDIEPKVKVVKLTKEEKEAYEQLMQALAITSSKLKIVQDTIRGEEEKEAIKKDRR